MKRGEGGTGTYADKHVPPWFFIGVSYDNRNRFRKRYMMENLCRREMITLKGGGMTGKVDAIGLTASAGLIPTFVGAGDYTLAMRGPDVARLNTLTRITYKDPRVLLSKGARGIRRIGGLGDTEILAQGILYYVLYYGLRQAGHPDPMGQAYPYESKEAKVSPRIAEALFAYAVGSNWNGGIREINSVFTKPVTHQLIDDITTAQISLNRPSELADFLYARTVMRLKDAVAKLRAKKVLTLQKVGKPIAGPNIPTPRLSTKQLADAVEALEQVPREIVRKTLIPVITSLGYYISEGYGNEEEWIVNPDRANGDVVLRIPVGSLFFPISDSPDLRDIEDLKLYYANLQFAGFRVFKPIPYEQIEAILLKTTQYLDKAHAVTPSESVAQKYREILRTYGGQIGRQQEPRAEVFDRSPMWWADTYR